MSRVERTRVAEDIGVDYRDIIKTSHGRRGVDTLKLYDPTKANFECRLFWKPAPSDV